VIAAGLIAGCMATAPQNQITVMTPAATAIPSGTADPRAAGAVNTYLAFVRTTNYLQRHPAPAVNGRYPEAANFAKYSVDPIQAQYEAFVRNLVRSRHAFRGAEPKSDVTVRMIDLAASPYPVVTLADCQTDRANWRAYNTQTNAMNPQMTPAIPAPYWIIIVLVRIQQRWKVQTIKPDPAGTCAG
jgi:hypothetical protein